MSTWSNIGLDSNGRTCEVEHGVGRRRVVTQRQARRLAREAGVNPLVSGLVGVKVDRKAFVAVAKSGTAMVRKFDTMASERKAYNEWKKSRKVVG